MADNVGAAVGDSVSVQIRADVLQGNARMAKAYARMISPVNDISALVSKLRNKKISPDDLNRDKQTPKFDSALALAQDERKNRKAYAHNDQQMKVALHDDGPLHVHIEKVSVPGAYNLSVFVEGDYCPEHDEGPSSGHDHSAMPATRHGGMEHKAKSECGPDCCRERFERLLTTLVPVSAAKRQQPKPSKKADRKKISKKTSEKRR